MPKPIKRIVIEFIDQSEHRYDTVGDWTFEPDGTLLVRVTRMREIWQQAVGLHELVEALLCNAGDISQEEVDAFDMGPGRDLAEPGFDLMAPYHVQHAWADVAERLFITASGESWAAYDGAVGDHGCEC